MEMKKVSLHITGIVLALCLLSAAALAADAPAPANADKAAPVQADEAAPAQADEAAQAKTLVEAKTLSLDQCIEAAMQNQASVLVSEQSVLSAKASYTEAKSSYFPQISVQNTPFSIGGNIGNTGGGTTSNGTSLVVTQTFFDGGLREASAKQAQFNVKETEEGLVRDQQTLAFNVTKAYYEALRSKHLAEVTDARMKYLQEQRDMIHTRVEVGDAAQVDELPVVAQLANARVDQLAAKNTIRTSLIELQNAVGLLPKDDFDIVDITAEPKVELDPVDKYKDLALANRPDVKQSAYQAQFAKAAVGAAKLNMLPRLVVNGQYNTRLDQSSRENWNINGGIVYNIFDGQRNKAVYAQARAGQASAELQAKQIEKDIIAQVQEAYLNLTSAGERLAATDLSLQASQQNYDAQQLRYKEGLAIPLDLLNAQVDVATALSNAVQAKYDYYTSKAQLDYAVGMQGGSYGKSYAK